MPRKILLAARSFLEFGKYIMSRVGKQKINIGAGTTVKMENGKITVTGKEGTLVRDFRPEIEIKIENNEITLLPKSDDVFSKKLWGTYAAHLKNMIKGVNESFSKKLLIEGIGYKAEVKDDQLVLNLGFSHQVFVPIPKELKVKTEKGAITISGSDKETVGQFAAYIRSLKKPEPYKGKGIRYEKEVVRRKAGKKAAASA